MKLNNYIFAWLLFLFSPFILLAQTNIVNVTPGYGTLNEAITANGSATYILQAGKWYGLNQTLEISVPVKIIGESTAGMPAIIQTGTTSAGATFGNMFTLMSNLTMENVFLVNADLNEGEGMGTFIVSGPGKLLMDSVTLDPVGSTFFMMKNYDSVSTFITNSLFMRHGNTISVNDGWLFVNMNGGKWDTLFVENNTFVDIGTDFYLPAAATDVEKFVWINHNSFIFGKANFWNGWGATDMYITNNLFWQFDFHPIQYAWSAYAPDADVNKVQGLVFDDTLAAETLPSARKRFIEYNSNYRSQGLWDLVAEFNNKGWAPAYLYDFIPSADSKDSCREARMYNDKTSFPHFFYNNNIRDYGAENKANDPDFKESKIYSYTDKVVDWARQSGLQNWGHQDADPSLWPNFLYSVDGNFGNPSTWPRFDGSYTNSKILTASIEKLPLGDLNWFPEQKKIWEAHSSEIMNNILSLDEEQMTLTDVKGDNMSVINSFALMQNYPNPFNPETNISYTVKNTSTVVLKVFDILGRNVATLVNEVKTPGTYKVAFNASKLASGTYFYEIQAGNFSDVKKMLYLK
jgi:hypothetical protein